MKKLAQSGGGTIYVSVKILFGLLPPAISLTRKLQLPAWSQRFPNRLGAKTAERMTIFGTGFALLNRIPPTTRLAFRAAFFLESG